MEECNSRSGKKTGRRLGTEDRPHTKPLPRRDGLHARDSGPPGGAVAPGSEGYCDQGTLGGRVVKAKGAEVRNGSAGVVEPTEKVDFETKCATFKSVKCPYCSTGNVKQYGQSRNGTVKYYRCKVCVFPDPEPEGQGDFTTFKAVETP